jgi:hypothetical protein
MQVKTQIDEIQNYLIDASNLQGGFSEKLFVPKRAMKLLTFYVKQTQKIFPLPFPVREPEQSAARFLSAVMLSRLKNLTK